MDSSMFDFIEKVVYINLANRIDRREHMEQMTNIFGDKVIRFEAIEMKPGCIGCSKSHIKVLELAIQNNWRNVLILEDDVEWNYKEEAYECFKNLTNNVFDVILLGGFRSKFDKYTYKLSNALGTSSYLVNGHYFQTLLNKQQSALSELLKNREHMSASQCRITSQFHCDRCWESLMEKDSWFIVVPNLLYQLDGYSDIISNKRTNLKSMFNL